VNTDRAKRKCDGIKLWKSKHGIILILECLIEQRLYLHSFAISFAGLFSPTIDVIPSQ
jgi:hypothetical protein